MRFPYANSARSGGVVVTWGLALSPSKDVAVLKLDEKAPSEAGIAVFSAAEVQRERWSCIGWDQESVDREALGEFGALLARGERQLNGPTGVAARIASGYSGAAVWADSIEAFVGMVVTKDRAQFENGVSYAIHTGALLAVWPRLQRNVRSSVSDAARGTSLAATEFGIRELIALFEYRANKIRDALRLLPESDELRENYRRSFDSRQTGQEVLQKFETLHKQHLEHIGAGRLALAHEVLHDIFEFLRQIPVLKDSGFRYFNGGDPYVTENNVLNHVYGMISDYTELLRGYCGEERVIPALAPLVESLQDGMPTQDVTAFVEETLGSSVAATIPSLLKELATGGIIQSSDVRSMAIRNLVVVDESEPAVDTLLSCLRAEDVSIGAALMSAIRSTSVGFRKLFTYDLSREELQEITPRLLHLMTDTGSSTTALQALGLLDRASILAVLRNRPELVTKLIEGLSFTRTSAGSILSLIWGGYSSASVDEGRPVRWFSTELLKALGDDAVGALVQAIADRYSSKTDAIVDILAALTRERVLAEIRQRSDTTEMVTAFLAIIAHVRSEPQREFAISVLADRSPQELSIALWVHPEGLTGLASSLLRTEARPKVELAKGLIVKRLALELLISLGHKHRREHGLRALAGLGDRELLLLVGAIDLVTLVKHIPPLLCPPGEDGSPLGHEWTTVTLRVVKIAVPMLVINLDDAEHGSDAARVLNEVPPTTLLEAIWAVRDRVADLVFVISRKSGSETRVAPHLAAIVFDLLLALGTESRALTAAAALNRLRPDAVRTLLADVQGDSAPVIAALIRGLGSVAPVVRHCSRHSLEFLGTKATRPLLATVGSDNRDARIAAAALLARLSESETEERLKVDIAKAVRLARCRNMLPNWPWLLRLLALFAHDR